MTREDAKWVLEMIYDRCKNSQNSNCSLTDAEMDAMNMAIEALDEVIECKQGKWIDRSDGGRILNPWWESYECSVCGAVSHNWNFCPNCGADMRG